MQSLCSDNLGNSTYLACFFCKTSQSRITNRSAVNKSFILWHKSCPWWSNKVFLTWKKLIRHNIGMKRSTIIVITNRKIGQSPAKQMSPKYIFVNRYKYWSTVTIRARASLSFGWKVILRNFFDYYFDFPTKGKYLHRQPTYHKKFLIGTYIPAVWISNILC